MTKTLCPDCQGSKQVKFCTTCCGIGYKYHEPYGFESSFDSIHERRMREFWSAQERKRDRERKQEKARLFMERNK